MFIYPNNAFPAQSLDQDCDTVGCTHRANMGTEFSTFYECNYCFGSAVILMPAAHYPQICYCIYFKRIFIYVFIVDFRTAVAKSFYNAVEQEHNWHSVLQIQ